MIERILIRSSGEPKAYFPEVGRFEDELAFEEFKAGLHVQELLDRIRNQVHCSAKCLKDPSSSTIQQFHANGALKPEYHDCIQYILRHPEFERLRRPTEAWLYSTANGKPEMVRLR